MKTNTTLHDQTHISTSTIGGNASVRYTFKLGRDVDLRRAAFHLAAKTD